jgi:type I restriction enzyme S subunit
VRRGVFNPKAIKPVSKAAEIPKGIEVVDGDFLLTRSNARDRVGDVCIAKGVRPKTILCDLIYRLQIRKRMIVPEFLAYQLLAPVGRRQIERDARGSSGTMPKISQGHIKSWRGVLPPLQEQSAITAKIDANTAQINSAIARTEREIALIREYCTRLTVDVVTGKLDVRDAARRLPTETVELEGPTETDELTDESELEPGKR